MRTALALLLVLAAASPAAAQAPLPPGMLGTWGHEAADCTTETSDGRVAVAAGEVEFFASTWTIRRWQRSGETWRGSARVESEGERSNGRIALRLLNDGRLEIRTDADEPQRLVKCAQNVPVR